MYLPKQFREDDPRVFHRIVDENPFATLISLDAQGEPFVNHLPMLRQGDRLIGHLARANPQWRHFRDGSQATVVFRGPHCYITPRWYAEHDVPTWNYVVAQARGKVTLVEDTEKLIGILRMLTERFESDAPKSWEFDVPEDLRAPGVLAKAIIGVEISIDRFEAKLKLGQNRSAADRAGMLDGLKAREEEDEMSHGILKWIERL